MPTLLLYTLKSSPRLKYTMDFIAGNLLLCDWKITHNAGELEKHNGPVINYSKNQIMNFLRIHPHKIMFEDTIENQFIKINRWQDIPVFFETDTFADLPFDIIACTFFLITRYEEYITHSFDEHGRFRHHDSLGYRYAFLHRPVVDEWGYALYNLLLKKSSTLPPLIRTFSVKPTIDIDNAYAIKHKPLMRQAGGFVRDLLSGRPGALNTRLKILSGKKSDPYDNYDYLINKLSSDTDKTPFFILFGKYGKYDKNIPRKNNSLRKLIEKLNTHFRVGLHPSYHSDSKPGIIAKEKNALENVCNNPITHSRQHYLMVRLPKTYKTLIDIGITDDYSMGYPGATGFRAGTCTPFMFFDLEQNKETPLTIHPFAFMDVTLEQYLRLNPAEAIDHINKLGETVKKVSGQLMFIWHNESLSEQEQWKGWRKVFETCLKINK